MVSRTGEQISSVPPLSPARRSTMFLRSEQPKTDLMALTLTITSYQRLSPGQKAQQELDQGSLRIGRASDNDWVLADPEMVLSKHHCTVEWRDGGYFLTDTSTNGVFVNRSEQRLGRGNSVELNDGDMVELGDFEIAVAIPGAVEGTAELEFDSGTGSDLLGEQTERLDPASLPDEHGSASEQPPAADGVAPGGDPLGLGDDTDGAGWDHYSEPDHLPSEHGYFQPPSARSETPEGEEPSVPKKDPKKDEDNALIPEDWEDSLMFKPPGVASPDSGPATQQSPGTERDDVDPFAEPSPAEPPAEPEPEEAHPAEPSPAGEPARPEPSPEPQPRRATPATAASVAREDLPAGDGLQAFLQGAGLTAADLPAGEDPSHILGRLGALFRQTTQGLMELLRARDSVKNEFRVERTLVGPVANNPMKILPTVEEAMRAMLTRHDEIWMPADRALREGFEDIRAHEMAMIAGMQAALSRLLERFDPHKLEQELARQSRIADLMAGGRKARNWDAFTQLYGKLAAKAEDDFQDLFRKEFARAYEAQLAKLRQR